MEELFQDWDWREQIKLFVGVPDYSSSIPTYTPWVEILARRDITAATSILHCSTKVYRYFRMEACQIETK